MGNLHQKRWPGIGISLKTLMGLIAQIVTELLYTMALCQLEQIPFFLFNKPISTQLLIRIVRILMKGVSLVESLKY